jgi:hypothetical protein
VVGVLFLELNGFDFRAAEADATQAVVGLAAGTLSEAGYAGCERIRSGSAAKSKRPGVLFRLLRKRVHRQRFSRFVKFRICRNQPCAAFDCHFGRKTIDFLNRGLKVRFLQGLSLYVRATARIDQCFRPRLPRQPNVRSWNRNAGPLGQRYRNLWTPAKDQGYDYAIQAIFSLNLHSTLYRVFSTDARTDFSGSAAPSADADYASRLRRWNGRSACLRRRCPRCQGQSLRNHRVRWRSEL